MGRKALSGKAKDSELRIRLTEEERAILDAAARNAIGESKQGTTSTWARGVLLRAAKRVKSS
jgi:hypothetical protein